MISVTVMHLQGYGEDFADLDAALEYAVKEAERFEELAREKGSACELDGIVAWDENENSWVLVDDNGWRWEVEE